jgi:hypothetical protein
MGGELPVLQPLFHETGAGMDRIDVYGLLPQVFVTVNICEDSLRVAF